MIIQGGVIIPKIFTNPEDKRIINCQVRLSKAEKERLDKVCNTLNLSYTEFFLISLDNLSSYLEKGFKNGKIEEIKKD